MKNNPHYLILLIPFLLLQSCQTNQESNNVITSDITNFWKAYDQIQTVEDAVSKLRILDSLYFSKGTIGLKAIREVRNYTPQDYLKSIDDYPKFWASIRENTLEANKIEQELEGGIEKLRQFYPDLKPAKIYFTIGAFRTGGTVLDSLVLIGSEISMADSTTVTEEFPEALSHLISHFKTNPNKHLMFLNIHEYIHTQQKPIVYNILSQSIREGVAEFIPTVVLEQATPNPQIEFGKQHANRIREVFEKEMFYANNMGKWLNSNATNEFGMRDLAYYVGYQMCENYYNRASDKKAAIKKMIELDYNNEAEIEEFVAQTNYFSSTLDSLYQTFENKRPQVISIAQFENGSQNVNPSIQEITFKFSEPLATNTGIDYGELGEEAFPKKTFPGRYWSSDKQSWTIPVTMEADKRYQFLITNNFRTPEGIPLRAYLVDFKTRKE